MASSPFTVKSILRVPLGSSAAPAIIFGASSTNTGIYSASNQVSVTIGGTEKFRVGSSINYSYNPLDMNSQKITSLATPTASSDAATKGYVDGAGIPIGFILLWSGSTGTIPTGYQICNGTNGTPDLRDRFVVGAGNSYAVGGTGGATSVTSGGGGAHTHGGTSGHTLSTGQLASHSHAIQVGGADDNNHTGNYDGPSDSDAGPRGYTRNTASTGNNESHSHGIPDSGTHTHTVATLPPYYALAYIQRIS